MKKEHEKKNIRIFIPVLPRASKSTLFSTVEDFLENEPPREYCLPPKKYGVEISVYHETAPFIPAELFIRSVVIALKLQVYSKSQIYEIKFSKHEAGTLCGVVVDVYEL